MDQTVLLYVMTAFVIIAAIALCVQARMLFQVHQTTRALQEKINPLVPKVESLVDATKATVEQSKQQLADISKRANEILESTKTQLAMVEGVVSEATTRAKVQMERVEMVLDDTLSRAQETVATVHDGIMKPLREINGIAVGVRTAIAFLSRGRRTTVVEATSDEEMFI